MSTGTPGRFDEVDRPRPDPLDVSPAQRARGEHLVAIHDMYRANLAQVRTVLDKIADGTLEVGEARAAVHTTGLRATYEQLGSFCGQMCSMVQVHHTIEDAHLYPPLRQADDSLGAVLDRLVEEHRVIHAVLVDLDAMIVAMIDDPEQLPGVHTLFERLEALLLSHFVYEEETLVDALGYYEIAV